MKSEIALAKNSSRFNDFLKNVKKDKFLLIIILPAVLYFLIFYYMPMYGVIIAFEKFNIAKGILGSPLIGFEYFERFFNSIYFFRLIRNTFVISFYSMVVNFTIPLLFAIMLNEVKSNIFKRTIQTISYFPYFISTVVVVGMLTNFLSMDSGIVNILMKNIGLEQIDFLNQSSSFRPIYILSGLWQSFGWNAIIFIGAIGAISPEMYEAASIDGVTRLQKIFYITLPCIFPVIVTLLILSLGGILNVGFEKIILMYNGNTMETADVLSTYVYRTGIVGGDYSFGAAVGLFNSVINLIFIVVTNTVSKRFTNISLW